MTSGDEAIAGLVGLARHAANNHAMVLLLNLEAAVAGMAPGSREARQASRALEAARAYDALTRALFGLWREERTARPRAEDYLAEMLPLLSLAAERRLLLEAPEPGSVLEIRRPTLDLALVRLAAGMPRDAVATLRLRGAVLEAEWRVEGDLGAVLVAAGVGIEPPGDGSALRLPQEATARS